MTLNQDSIDPILHSCLDVMRTEHETISSALDRFPTLPRRLRWELEAALWLMLQIPVLDPSHQFLAISRRRIQVRIQQELTMQSQLLRPPKLGLGFPIFHNRSAYRITFVLMMIVSFALGGSGATLASLRSLPNDTFYPFKIALEGVALFITPGSRGDLDLHMEFTRRRLQEVQSLVLEGQAEWVPHTTARFEAEAYETIQGLQTLSQRDGLLAGKLAISFRQQLEEQTEKIFVMQDVVPLSAWKAIEETLQISQRVLQELEDLGL